MLQSFLSLCLVASNIAGIYFGTRNFRQVVKEIDQVSFEIKMAADLAARISKKSEESAKNFQQTLQSAFTQSDSKASLKVLSAPARSIYFEDIYGASEAKEVLERSMDMLVNPEKYRILQCESPQNILLYGPPGTGKTSIVNAAYNHLIKIFDKDKEKFSNKKPMYVYVDCSRIGGVYVVDAANQIRALFEHCRDFASRGYIVILVLNEIDNCARIRGGVTGKLADSAVNEMVSQLDYVQKNMIIVGTTNDKGSIDPAIMRDGRIGVSIKVPFLKWQERFEMLSRELRKLENLIQVPANYLENIVSLTSNFSGAKMKAIIELSKIFAINDAQENSKKITMTSEHLLEAFMEVSYGKKKLIQTSKEDLYLTAIHEAGHAVTNYFLDENSYLSSISIIPRGPFLGVCFFGQTAEQENRNLNQEMLENEIAMFYGGAAAEEYHCGSYGTGVSSDFSRGEKIAELIKKLGMSSNGKLALFYTKKENVYKLKEITQRCFSLAQKVVQENAKVIKTIADYLMEHKEMNRETFEEIMKLHIAKKESNGSNGSIVSAGTAA
ncbi:MAG: AAA family ATPase [Oscillospiraceae bacterium]|jgi:cell division protease FtsH|nr:AAA family ATPase [Oscillospiraceae bacterium]